TQRIEARVYQHKHQQQRDGYGYEQPANGLLFILELPAPGDEVSRRSLDVASDHGLRVVNEAADVAPLDVAHHHDSAQRVFAADDRVAGREFERRQLSKRDSPAYRRRNQYVVELFDLIAEVLAQPHEYGKPPL